MMHVRPVLGESKLGCILVDSAIGGRCRRRRSLPSALADARRRRAFLALCRLKVKPRCGTGCGLGSRFGSRQLGQAASFLWNGVVMLELRL